MRCEAESLTDGRMLVLKLEDKRLRAWGTVARVMDLSIIAESVKGTSQLLLQERALCCSVLEEKAKHSAPSQIVAQLGIDKEGRNQLGAVKTFEEPDGCGHHIGERVAKRRRPSAESRELKVEVAKFEGRTDVIDEDGDNF